MILSAVLIISIPKAIRVWIHTFCAGSATSQSHDLSPHYINTDFKKRRVNLSGKAILLPSEHGSVCSCLTEQSASKQSNNVFWQLRLIKQASTLRQRAKTELIVSSPRKPAESHAYSESKALSQIPVSNKAKTAQKGKQAAKEVVELFKPRLETATQSLPIHATISHLTENQRLLQGPLQSTATTWDFLPHVWLIRAWTTPGEGTASSGKEVSALTQPKPSSTGIISESAAQDAPTDLQVLSLEAKLQLEGCPTCSGFHLGFKRSQHLKWIFPAGLMLKLIQALLLAATCVTAL